MTTASSKKVQVGIVGAGIAGLSMAWLLDPELYEVILFEKEDRLGGHAYTVEVKNDKGVSYIDAGAQFFYDTDHPTFKRLLGILDVPIKDLSVDFTLRNDITDYTLPVNANLIEEIKELISQVEHDLEPLHFLRSIWKALTDLKTDAKTLFDLWQFTSQALGEVLESNWGITVEEYVNSLNFPEEFKQDFLWPFLTTTWTVGEHIKGSSALGVLSFVALAQPGGLNPFTRNIYKVWGVVDGTQAYVKKIAADIEQMGQKIIYPAPVAQTERKDGKWFVSAADKTYQFDYLILASPAFSSVKFLPKDDRFTKLRETLGNFDFLDTFVDVHRDASFMPKNKADWMTLYQYWDGFDNQFTTVWQDNPQDENVFKTWVTHSKRQPDDIIKHIHFYHLNHHPSYFLNQYRIAALQGKENLWLTGTYTHGVDSHENALKASINVALQLDNIVGNGNLSPNLFKLIDWEKQYAPPEEPSQGNGSSDGWVKHKWDL